ncbi:MAG: alanine--tRNA ligase [bacterium]|nr:alanine--tRNA ligase [bacterium]
MTSADIRSAFLSFFTARGHTLVDSSPVVPHNDPTLLFANAGMNQFKHVFIGIESRPYSRATSCQKCIRAGGKHNDLDNVGKTPRHHTFFEMLGNFSFGDYFKADAISFAWELLTKTFALPPHHLWVTVFEDDDEAERLWAQFMPAHRIIRLGKKDNFWEMGDTGPCGPCSEIHLDLRSFFGGAKPDTLPFDDSSTLELWNLVFMQFHRREDGTLDKLPKPSVDTGAGLERLTSILQGVHSNYESDLFSPLIAAVERLSGISYTPLELFGPRPLSEAELDAGMPHRVIADHIRAVAFALADGAVFSNEGRGYVLRRILRRAVRYGRRLGIEKPFLADLVDVLERILGSHYPSLRERSPHIKSLITAEEVRFEETLGKGIELFHEVVARSDPARKVLAGEDAFRLYDTYGFPLDITQDMAREIGWQVDLAGFEECLRSQRQRAKAARAVTGPRLLKVYEDLFAELGDTTFTGYTSLTETAVVTALIDAEGTRTFELPAGSPGVLIVDRTPFYGEAGGQVGDTGALLLPSRNSTPATITHVTRPTHNLFAHHVEPLPFPLRVGDQVLLQVDQPRRQATMRHHTATHLLHAALHAIIGKHATQTGSAVSPERLRFDFHHHTALSPDELERIELFVNEQIVRDLPVTISETTLDQARSAGAIMLFDEKYGARVRMVTIPGVSCELCGGTHAPSTGFLGLFLITSESAIAAGVRRIEALCGLPALREVQRQRALLRRLAQSLNVKDEDLAPRVEKLQDDLRQLQKKLKEARSSNFADFATKALQRATTFHGATLIVANLGEAEPATILAVGDQLKARVPSHIIVLGSQHDDKCHIIAQFSDDQVKAGLHAGTLVKELAKIVGGGGGGRPHTAQAGGSHPEKLDQALNAVPTLLKSLFPS